MAPLSCSIDYYAVLGVPYTADEATIKAAYRRLAHLKHPDKNGDSPESTEEFQLVSASPSNTKARITTNATSCSFNRPTLLLRIENNAVVLIANTCPRNLETPTIISGILRFRIKYSPSQDPAKRFLHSRTAGDLHIREEKLGRPTTTME